MRSALTSFWINIGSSVTFGAIAALVAKYPLGLTILNSLGIGILILVITFTAVFVLGRRIPQTSQSEPHAPQANSSKRLEADTISGGTIIQADRIGQIQIREVEKKYVEAPATDEAEVRFITEGTRRTPRGFRVLFSIWNDGAKAVKLFEFLTKEYVREDSVAYYGGARHVLQLIQNRTTLWDGETYEIPPGKSASFDLRYTIKTGPLDGEPWIVFGIVSHYHDPNGTKLELHSDSVYLLAHNSIRVIPLDRLEELNEPNMFIHGIYADTLQVLSNHLQLHRDKIIWLMREDYNIGFAKLKAKVLENKAEDDLDKIQALQKRLITIVDGEKLLPLGKETLAEKYEILEHLRRLSVKYCSMAFVHLCQTES